MPDFDVRVATHRIEFGFSRVAKSERKKTFKLNVEIGPNRCISEILEGLFETCNLVSLRAFRALNDVKLDLIALF
jgi:hypothetical protein